MPPPGMSIIASTLNAGWGNVHAVILSGRLEEFFGISASLPVIWCHLKGDTSVEWKRGGRYSRFLAKPGDVLITAPSERNALRTNLPGEWLVCPIDPELLLSLVAADWKPRGRSFEIVESFNKNDAETWHLGERLASQLRAPESGSRPYAEALYTQLGIQLLWNYSSLSGHRQPQTERLADHRLRRAVEYVHDTLGDDISLEALAEVAGLSPNYFASAFKQAMGKTPYRYVIEQRIAKACGLLHDPHCSITEVSAAVGFSSQSHLTEAFRRYMKTTPAAYRKEVLGLTGATD
jgi:AraC family transcriptional regulator